MWTAWSTRLRSHPIGRPSMPSGAEQSPPCRATVRSEPVSGTRFSHASLQKGRRLGTRRAPCRHTGGPPNARCSAAAPLDGVAGLVGALVHPDLPPTVREHLGHERQTIQRTRRVQARQNLGLAPDLDEFTCPKVQHVSIGRVTRHLRDRPRRTPPISGSRRPQHSRWTRCIPYPADAGETGRGLPRTSASRAD